MMILAMTLVASMIEVRASDAEGVERRDVEAIVEEALASLESSGHEVCWRSLGPDQSSISVAKFERCAGPTASDVLEITTFGAVSRIRVVLARANALGVRLAEAETDVAKDDLTSLRGVIVGLVPPPPSIMLPTPSPPPKEEPVWPFAVGVGGAVVGTVGVGFLVGAAVTRGEVGGPGADPIGLESIEERRTLYTWVGGALLGVGIGAAITWYMASSD